MNLDIIRYYSPSDTHAFKEQAGALVGQALGHLQDKRIAGVVVFMQIAIKIVRFLFGKFYDKIENHPGETSASTLLLSLTCAVTISSMTIMNVALSRLLRLPLHPWVTVGIATSVVVGQFAYWIFRE